MQATERDLVWLSPEAIALCHLVDVAPVFAEHATVTVGLDLTCCVHSFLSWPRPLPIPWDTVQEGWDSHASCPPIDSSLSVDHQWAAWASSFQTA